MLHIGCETSMQVVFSVQRTRMHKLAYQLMFEELFQGFEPMT